MFRNAVLGLTRLMPLASRSSQSFYSLAPSLTSVRSVVPISSVGPTGIIARFMNRNARRPKKANHGKRPVSNVRRRMKKNMLKSRAHKVKLFGFW